MATKIRFATAGIAGVTEFVASEVTADITAAGGSAYAVTGDAPITITLPATPRSGDVIAIKNLTTGGVQVTVDRNGNMIDGETNNITSMVSLERWELIYINATLVG